MGKPLSPWARIARAAEYGTGVRLSADDVRRLMGDDAIYTRGNADLEEFRTGIDPIDEAYQATNHE